MVAVVVVVFETVVSVAVTAAILVLLLASMFQYLHRKESGHFPPAVSIAMVLKKEMTMMKSFITILHQLC